FSLRGRAAALFLPPPPRGRKRPRKPCGLRGLAAVFVGVVEDVFQLAKKSLAFFVVVVLQGALELFQGLARGLVLLLGDLPVALDVHVAPAPAVQVLDALAPQAESGAALGALGQGVLHLAVDGGHGDVVPQHRLAEGDGDGDPDVVAVPLEQVVGPHRDHDDHIAGGAAVGAGVAHAPQGKALVVVDAHGDADLQGLFGGHPAAAVADLAGVLDDLALAAAAGAGLLALHDSKGGALLLDDIAAAAAVGAGLGLAAGGRAAAAALGAGLLPGDGDVLFAAVDRLVKAQGDAHPDVLALAGGVGVGACAAPKPAEAAAEDVPGDVPQVHPAKAAEAAGPAALAGRVVGVHPRKAELVVALAL